MNIAITYISRIRTRPHPNRDGFRDHLPPGTLGDRNHDIILPESMVKYGVFGGIGYALMGAIALSMFSFIGKRVRQDFPVGLTIGDYLKARLHPLGYWILIVILVITSFHILFIQGMAASTLCQFLFDTPLYVGLFFFRFLRPLCWIRRVKAHSWIRSFSSHLHVCRSYLDSIILFRQGRDSACL